MTQTVPSRRRAYVALGASVFAVMSPVLAHAQDDLSDDAADVESRERSSGLQEITVTAERRSQNLQDVPISATVLTGEDLASRGTTNLIDVQQVAPSVAINTFNRSTYINIRGVGIAVSTPTTSPGVAFYVDGQPIPQDFFIGESFFDIGTIEVLRGPQGTLTGQNSTGGAILIRSPEPRFDPVPSGYLDVTVGEFSHFRSVAALNVGAGDNVALRVAAVRDKRDSFSKNIGSSERTPGDIGLLAGRANLAVRADDLRVNVRGEYYDSKNDNTPIKNRNDIAFDTRSGTDAFVIAQDADTYQHKKGYRLNAEVRYDIGGGLELRGMTSYQHGNLKDLVDGDLTSVSPPNVALPTNPLYGVGRVSTNDLTFGTFAHEVNLIGDTGNLDWVLGAFLLDEEWSLIGLRDQTNTVTFVQPSATTMVGGDNSSKSVFGQLNLFATPRLELIAGARYNWDKRIYDRTRLGRGEGVSTGPTVGTTVVENEKLTGKLGVNYHLDDVLLYASASKGYKAGGNNLNILSGDPPQPVPPFGPETNFVYEAGWKSTFLDRRLRVNGAVFYSDYQDIQLNAQLNGQPLTFNAASGRAIGAELELTGQFGELGFNFGGGFLDAEFAEDSLVQDTISNSLRLVSEGDRLPFSPKWTLNAGLQYEFRLSEDVYLTPRAQWSHLSGQLATPFPSMHSIVPGRHVFDARVALDIADKYRVEGYVSNLTNKTYIASQIQNTSSAAGGIIYGAPRQFGMRFLVRFGNE